MSTITKLDVQITLFDAPLGAVVTGFDASQPIAPEIILQFKQALCDRQILIFKNQQLTNEQFLNFFK
ncbi:hypothetical protein [Calothrix sp. 336/3]|uniref:hypothetical protein n=1 Tax=Calothrix sp. 336/3 TaxID=1337936 RepID=UPI0004E2B204|nr:hypothetical protein [Calothrix sp. 336/3]AKG21459.1 hypothetical protein IJ00_09285 [Calothrix sp. 336/3]